MKTHINELKYKEYIPSELPEEYKELVKEALEATKTAYAPYSHFQVGAAARTKDNKIIKGSNQENAAYPAGLCAERVALFQIQSTYPNTPVVTLAIAATSNGEQTESPVFPCGSCRQVMLEHELRHGVSMTVLFVGKNMVLEVSSASGLLPLHFTPDMLK